MNTVLLSICIPTFNRVAYLRELLPALIGEANMVNQGDTGVEIVVSDNASHDETQAFCQSLHCPFMAYYRNDVNIGGDRNFLACVSRAKGKYVWLFGDDELIWDGGLLRTVTTLLEEQPSLLVLIGAGDKAAVSYADYAECLRHEMQRQTDFPLAHTLITANIFCKAVFDLPFAQSLLYTSYAHMYGLVVGLRAGGKVTVLSEVIRVRPSRAQFAHWPFALCVKQAVYLWHIARWFHVPCLFSRAVRIALNLPVELAACMVHRCFPKFGRT